MQENNDKYAYEEIDGKIVSVEEATEIQKNQKKSLRLKIAVLCLAIIGGGLIISEINDKDTNKDNTVQESDNNQFSDEKNTVYNQESKEYIDKMIDEYLKPSFDSMKTEIITTVCEEAYEAGQAAAISFGKNAVKDPKYAEYEVEAVRNAYNLGYENGLKVYNEVKAAEEENNEIEKNKTVKLSRSDMLKSFIDKGLSIEEAENEVLAIEEKEANENDSLTLLESFFVEMEVKNSQNIEDVQQIIDNFKFNYHDYPKYKRLVFLDKNTREIVITTPYNLSDYWIETGYEYIGSSDKVDVFVYEKEVRNVQMDDTDNYNVISDWSKTGEYVITDGTHLPSDDISTKYVLRALAVRGEGIQRKWWHPYSDGISEDINVNEISKDSIVNISKIADNVYDAARGNFISQDKIYEEAFSDENIRELNDYGIVEGKNIQAIESNDGTIIGYTVEENTTSGKVR